MSKITLCRKLASLLHPSPKRGEVTLAVRSRSRSIIGVLALGVCLTALAVPSGSALAAEAPTSTASLTPVLSLQGETVQWASIGPRTVYVIAISNKPRGAAGRTTQYLLTLGNAGEAQAYTPALLIGQTVYVGVSADGGLTWSAEETTVTGLPKTVQPTIQGETVHWKAVGTETSYEIAISNAPRGAAGRTTRYLNVFRKAGEAQSYTPALKPGQTVYVGVSADDGFTWSPEEAIATGEEAPAPEEPAPPPAEEAPAPPNEGPGTTPVERPAPVLKLSGDTITWSAIAGSSTYTLATILNPTTTRDTTYTVVTGTSYTPPAVPGQTVSYGLSTGVPGEGPWAKEVTITYPAAPAEGSTGEGGGGSTGEAGGGAGGSGSGEATGGSGGGESSGGSGSEASGGGGAGAGKIIGTNGGAGWGEAPAKTILSGHITWNRVEIGTAANTVAQSLKYGFKVLAIVGNTSDGTPLSQTEPSQWGSEVVNEIKANPGISIAEAGNEVYFKGGVANPVQYGKMYLAAINAMKAAGIHIPLLFDMWGDYTSTTGFSSDSNGRGWLRDAVNGVPGLAAAIIANGFSSHPYGSIGENYEDEAGVDALAAQEAVALNVLGSVPPFYLTEFGYDMSSCGAFNGACSQQEQASKLRAAYKVLLSDPHVEGIWWYQSHDDSTGEFGFMNTDGTTRPSFEALSAIAIEQGQ